MKKIIFVTILISLIFSSFAQDTVKSYWSNKALMSKGIMRNGEEDGEWKFYHTNGQLWTQGSYVMGKKVGLWRTWNEAGQLNQ